LIRTELLQITPRSLQPEKEEIVERIRQLVKALLIMVNSPEVKIARTKLRVLFKLELLDEYRKIL